METTAAIAKRLAQVGATQFTHRHGSGSNARTASARSRIGIVRMPENFTVIAAPMVSASTEQLSGVTRCPTRQAAAMNARKTSAIGTSSFSRGECARKFGSRQNAAAATAPATGPPSRHAHHAIPPPSAIPSRSIRQRAFARTPIASLPGV